MVEHNFGQVEESLDCILMIHCDGVCMCQSFAFLILGVVLQLMGLVLFVLGFFPVKPALTGISDIQSMQPGCHISNCNAKGSSSPVQSQTSYQEAFGVPPQFDRLIIMVVDGLPAEFLLGRGGQPPSLEIVTAMPYVQGLLSGGMAFGYHAKAAPPTVTMPRLKALTSGAIAGFLDVAFNFNTQALLEDNLIGQLARAGWRMVMLGDETWLRLFPNTFMRHDGVSSFYVKDTAEVDHNVTRHLDTELAATDWDLMVLHYLGLDHVGHLGGRSSSLMAPKLKEMDAVIERIHRSLLANPTGRHTLMMVASDHGMTDAGNHGGASYQETDALAMFIAKTMDAGPSLDLPAGIPVSTPAGGSAFQVDVVPTLSLLLGVPIPKNSVGILLPRLFRALPPKEHLRALELNAWQIFRLLHVRSPGSFCITSLCSICPGENEQGGSRGVQYWWAGNDRGNHRFCALFRQAMELHHSWSKQSPHQSEEENLSQFETVREAYLQFLKPTSEWLARGTTKKCLLFLVAGGSLMLLSTINLIWVWFHICKGDSVVTQVARSSPPRSMKPHGFLLEELIAVGGVCIHAATLASSSFVEEEQYTWHFLVSTLSIALIRHSLQPKDYIHATSLWHLWGVQPFSDQLHRQEEAYRLHQLRYLSPEAICCTDGKVSVACSSGAHTLPQVVAVAVVLFIGRLLRGWHRSGVNWSHLPDIAKWLEDSDVAFSMIIQVVSLTVVTSVSFILTLLPAPRQLLRRALVVCMGLSALFILIYVRSTSNGRTSALDILPTYYARAVFMVLGMTAMVAFLGFPWVVPLTLQETNLMSEKVSLISEADRSGSSRCQGEQGHEDFALEAAVQSAMDSIGRVFVSCWCLLQLLLQQSVNTVPVALLLLQLLAMATFFRQRGMQHSHWLSVLTLYWMGASGHFGLGNSNTLATVDVAGAYIGLSSHSTVLSGLLAFIITYASPFLFMLGMLLLSCPLPKAISKKVDIRGPNVFEQWRVEALTVPCILPMAVNGVILAAFTGILTLMQNHLFVWSVFSPKYLYVCGATICTSVGAFIFAITGVYSSFVIRQRARWIRVVANAGNKIEKTS